MPKPNLRAVDNETEHPRDRARRRVRDWRSNAQRDQLPISNIHDDKGADVLDVDAVLRKSEPHYAKK